MICGFGKTAAAQRKLYRVCAKIVLTLSEYDSFAIMTGACLQISLGWANSPQLKI